MAPSPDSSSKLDIRQCTRPRDPDGPLGNTRYSAREIASGRNKGQFACAECYRLKMKCDRNIPCDTCQRRGCPGICPNGSFITGAGSKSSYVIATTQYLHDRIGRMNARIQTLEDALAVLQLQTSREVHPLLRNVEEPQPPSTADGGETEVPTDAATKISGTITIKNHGVPRFFGPTGGPEGLLLASSEGGIQHPSSTWANAEATGFSIALPFTSMGSSHEVYAIIYNYLPCWEHALSICEVYLENAAWLFPIVPRRQLIDEILPVVYKRKASDEEYGGPHHLALMMGIFAVGTFVDTRLTMAQSEAESVHYDQLAKAALSLHPVMEKSNLVTIQALRIISIYNAMSGGEICGSNSSMETAWSLTGLAIYLSKAIGLHRDSARAGVEFPENVVQLHRTVFWDLFVADAWQSLSTGRPPLLFPAFIDCQFPKDEKIEMYPSEEVEPGFGLWGFRFALDCVSEVATRTLSAQGPRYPEILELDRKIRDFRIPGNTLDVLGQQSVAEPSDMPLSSSMTRFMLKHMRDTLLMFVHRTYFAQALIEDPVDPTRNQYARSFLATVRAASDILRSVKEQFAIHPAMCSRLWNIWMHAFSAAVVFGVIVTRGPRSNLAAGAMLELEAATYLFSEAAQSNRCAAKAHVVLSHLKKKADSALNRARNGSPYPSAEEEDIMDEFSCYVVGQDIGRDIFLSAEDFRSTGLSSRETRSPEVAANVQENEKDYEMLTSSADDGLLQGSLDFESGHSYTISDSPTVDYSALYAGLPISPFNTQGSGPNDWVPANTDARCSPYILNSREYGQHSGPGHPVRAPPQASPSSFSYPPIPGPSQPSTDFFSTYETTESLQPYHDQLYTQ